MPLTTASFLPGAVHFSQPGEIVGVLRNFIGALAKGAKGGLELPNTSFSSGLDTASIGLYRGNV